uniref:Uncharacterized protein n=1 Tax=Wuchereria bancrofti TaxID=6293 RepID=A0AAF5PN50_WUCBA
MWKTQPTIRMKYFDGEIQNTASKTGSKKRKTKTATFLLYLYLPNYNGTQMLFYNVVNPTISTIDDFINTYMRK